MESLNHLAEAFSKAFIERNKDDFEFSLFSIFPFGCCEYSSLLLASYLISRNASLTIYIVLGENPEDDDQLQTWLIADGLHIDITGYQFDKSLPKVIVSEKNPWNGKFNVIAKSLFNPNFSKNYKEPGKARIDKDLKYLTKMANMP